LAIVSLPLAHTQAQEPKRATIEGFVVGPQYERFNNFEIEIVKGKWHKSVVTDSEGHFEFRDLDPGIYFLQPEKKKPMCLVALRKVKIRIEKDEAVHADLELKLADDWKEKCVVE
jgi:hypothetical protein